MNDLLEGWGSKVEGVGPNILRPALDVLLERGTVACVKRAGRFLISGKITSHH